MKQGLCSTQRTVRSRKRPSLFLPGPTTASLRVSRWLRSVASTLNSPSSDASTGNSSPSRWVGSCPEPRCFARSLQCKSQQTPWAGWMIAACMNAAVMSHKKMYLASFMFLLAANANNVRATASGGVLIFGIHVSVPTVFTGSVLLVVVSSPFCVWLHRHRNHRGARR